MPASKRCLVIGGNGFVGSAVVRAARARRFEVSIGTRENSSALRDAMFDIAVNANGNSLRFRATENPRRDFEETVLSAQRSLFDVSAERYVFLSTTDVYDDIDDPTRTRETTIIDPTRLEPYGFHKRLAELCVERYARSFQIVRLAHMVGSGLAKGPIFDLATANALRSHPETCTPFMDVDAVAAAVFTLAERAPPNAAYNLCGRGSVAHGRIAELFPTAQLQSSAAPRRHAINLDKTSRWIDLPDSWSVVERFIERLAREPELLDTARYR